MPDRTLREWERDVIIGGVDARSHKLLRARLQQPASPTRRRFYASLGNWQPAKDGACSASTSCEQLCADLRKALAVIWHFLDTPTPARTGLARDMLLIVYAQYLRVL